MDDVHVLSLPVERIIQKALSPICKVALEELPKSNPLPDEFIVVDRIDGNEDSFADDKAQQNYHLYRINYYGKSKLRRQEVMGMIKAQMKSVGFYLKTDNKTIPRENGATYYGAYSDFAYWGAV